MLPPLDFVAFFLQVQARHKGRGEGVAARPARELGTAGRNIVESEGGKLAQSCSQAGLNGLTTLVATVLLCRRCSSAVCCVFAAAPPVHPSATFWKLATRLLAALACFLTIAVLLQARAMHPDAASLRIPSSVPKPAAAARVRFAERDDFDSPLQASSGSSSSSGLSYSDDDASVIDSDDDVEYAAGVLRDASSWAGNLPAAQGLVRPDFHDRSCTVRADFLSVCSTTRTMSKTRAVWA